MKILVFGLVLAMLLIVVTSGGVAPQPYCLSKPIYKAFPLTREEIISHDVSDMFSGYNLQIQVPTNNSFVTLSEKFKQLDRRNVYLPSIISHYLEHKDNGIGKDSFILYKDITGSVHFNYGQVTSKASLPELNSTAVVTTEKNVECFDAALFLEYGLAIIDCIKINNKNTEEPFTNMFYYLDLTSHSVKKKVQTPTFVDFGAVTKRKLIKFTQSENNYPYLLRAYLSEGVKDNSDNSYFQLFGAQDPGDLQTFALIDRTYFREPKLAINDIQVYNGEIFVLDSYVGVYRLDVSKSHQVLWTGRYRQQGMQKFAIYSDDLEDELILAMANSHNVYEIEWTDMIEPFVVNKYTLISDSTVKEMQINDKYVIVQSKATAGQKKEQEKEIDYTWIFTKSSRTYTNAYHVINHNSTKVQIDFDSNENHLYTADEGGLALYRINEPRLNLLFTQESQVGKNQTVTIKATSTDPNTDKIVECKEEFVVSLVDKEDTRIFQTGYQMNRVFSANYPGQLHIPLDRRFLGPNITYSVEHLESKQIPQHWINMVNQTFLHINSDIHPQDITFFHTDMLQQYGRQLLIYYYEDTKNNTHVAECVHAWEDRSINCEVTKQYHHESRIASFSTAYYLTGESWEYFYIMTLEGQNNEVTIIDFVRHKIVAKISYAGHQEAQVHQVAASNGFLYVLRKNIKTIDVYSLRKCKQNGECNLEFKIDPSVVKTLGVDYFAPQYITTDMKHPEVLFIKCLGSVVILDVDNSQKLHLLDQIVSAATKDFYFRVAVNKYRMLLVAQPDIIEQYSLETVYQKDSVTLMKNYPLYGYRIQPNADIEFSDQEFLVYINAFDPKVNVSVILAYRTGYPSAAVLYHTIYLDKLYSRPGFEVQVSGNVVDFLSIASGNEFKVYRVFEFPTITFNNTFFDYSLNIHGQNPSSNVSTLGLNISVVNWPDEFTPTAEFNQTQTNLKIQNHGNFSWEDRKWFKGNVINFNYSCEECNTTVDGQESKIRLREHIDNFHELPVGGNDYIETKSGGIAVYQDLFLFHHNGSIRQVINLPDQKILESCIKVAAFQTEQFVVTACQELGRGINLYLTSLQSFKPITDGPYLTEAKHARTLQVVHDVVMIMDQNAFPDYRLQPGSVFLYRLSANSESYQQFDLIEEIDGDDLMAAHGWDKEDAIIGNAHLTYSTYTNTFRLYLTEIDNGLFIIDFTRHSYQAQIHILSVRYLDMNKLLKQYDLHMPSDATYQAVTFTGIIASSHSDMENILITTKGYHNFEVTLVYDQQDQLISSNLHRIYYRYGYYETYNEVKAISGYVAIGYIIPSTFSLYTQKRRQYVAVYDNSDYAYQSKKGYSERYMLGGFPLDHREPSVFAFNKTYDYHSNGTRIGLIVSQPSTGRNRMTSASLSKTLQVEARGQFKDQTMKITAYNDFKNFSFQVRIINEGLQNEILFIIIIVVAVILVVFFVCYLCSVFNKKKQQQYRMNGTGERESLITENQSFIKDSISREEQYRPPVVTANKQVMVKEDSGYSSDEESGPGVVRKQQATQVQAMRTQEEDSIKTAHYEVVGDRSHENTVSNQPEPSSSEQSSISASQSPTKVPTEVDQKREPVDNKSEERKQQLQQTQHHMEPSAQQKEQEREIEKELSEEKLPETNEMIKEQEKTHQNVQKQAQEESIDKVNDK